MSTEEPSRRLVDQRIRNRMMEEALRLSHGDEDVQWTSAPDYFEDFFDWFEYTGPIVSENSAINEKEKVALAALLSAMQQAIRETPPDASEDQLIAGGWPRRIAPLAKVALDVFLERGRFSEEVEQEMPSSQVPWP